MVAPRPDVTYQLDPADRIIDVNEAWQAFADANAGAALRAPAILGQSLWDHISDPTTVELYRQMLQRVRRHAGTVRFEFRCDSPTRRRLLAMEIAPDRAGTVRFTTQSIREEPREPVPVLDATVDRAAPPITICGWCKRVDVGEGRWEEIEAAVETLRIFDRDTMPLLSHGMCPTCYDGMSDLLERGASRPA